MFYYDVLIAEVTAATLVDNRRVEQTETTRTIKGSVHLNKGEMWAARITNSNVTGEKKLRTKEHLALPDETSRAIKTKVYDPTEEVWYAVISRVNNSNPRSPLKHYTYVLDKILEVPDELS